MFGYLQFSCLQAAEVNVSEKPVEINPQGDVKAVVIWLHGLGADGHDFEPIVPELNLPKGHGIRFVFPQAAMQPVTINGGYVMRAWYDIKNGDLSREEDAAGVRESARKISDLIKEEMQRYSLPAHKIVIAGFSQGGVIALHTALRYPQQLGGVMVLSAYVALPETVEKERSQANNAISIFMAHGKHDPVIAISHAQASRDQLTSFGYQVNWHSYDMEHSVVPDEIDDIAEWVKKQLIE